MKKILLICSFVLIALSGNSQVMTFVKTYGESYPYLTRSADIIESNQGYLLLSSRNGYLSNPDTGTVICTDHTGLIKWGVSFTDTISKNIEPRSIFSTADGGCLIFGNYYKSNYEGIFLLKLDSSHQFSWSKTYGINVTNGESCWKVIRTSDNCYLVCGRTLYIDQYTYHDLRMKVDQNGSVVWAKSFMRGNWLRDVMEVSGNYYFLGAGGSSLNPFLNKTDTNGKILTGKTASNVFAAYCLDTTIDKGFIIGGNGIGTALYGSLTRMDSTGKVLWSKRINNSTSSTSVYHVKSLIDGTFLVNINQPTSNMAKIDSIGNFIWNKSLYQTQTLSNFILKADKGFVAFGDGLNTSSLSYYTVLSKTDSLGATQNCSTTSVNFTATSFSTVFSIDNISKDSIIPQVVNNTTFQVAPLGNSNIVCFNPAPSPVVTINGSTICSGNCYNLHAMVTKGTPPYSYSWLPNIGNEDTISVCPASTTVYSVIVVDIEGNTSTDTATITVYSKGITPTVSQSGDTLITQQGYISYQWYIGNTPINGATNYLYLATSNGLYSLEIKDSSGCDYFITDINVTNTSLGHVFPDLQFSFNPNPTSDNINILFNDNTEREIKIISTTGVEVYSTQISDRETTINLKLKAGIYFVKVTNGKETFTRKVVIN